MSKQRCASCCFGDICRDSYECDNYAPIDGCDDTYIDDVIESGRRDFFDDWYQYISEYSD